VKFGKINFIMAKSDFPVLAKTHTHITQSLTKKQTLIYQGTLSSQRNATHLKYPYSLIKKNGITP